MIEISYLQMVIAISILWVIVRAICSLKVKRFDWKRELQLLLVYICIVVVVRFTTISNESTAPCNSLIFCV